HVDDARLKEFFSAHGEVTDARVMKTKEGRSRCFGFVGFRSPVEAKKALRAVDKTFMDTSRLQVAMALAAHSSGLPRAWSKYSKAEQSVQEHPATGGHHNAPAVKSREERQAEEEERRNAVIAGNAEKVEHVGVRRGKAGVASVRTHVAFKDEDEESSDDEGSTVEGEQQDAQTLNFEASDEHAAAQSGFGGGGSDMDFLRSKMVASEDKKDHEAAEDGEEDNEEAEGESDAGGEDSDAVLMDTARLLLVNLPYIATEDDIKKAFQKFGSIEDVVVLRDEDSKKSRGMAYVTYLFPEHAVRAKSEMHGKVFQGRVLRIKAAQARPTKHVERDEKRLSRKQEQLKKRRENAEQHTWNLLFVSANSAVIAAANKLGLTKADIMDVEADDLAVRAAVGETEV
ncbi:RNA binding motif protein 19, partial [Perkinsus olseni]